MACAFRWREWRVVFHRHKNDHLLRRFLTDLVARYLREDYPGERMMLGEAEQRELVEGFARLSIAGGATYDGIVAATAAHHGRSLISCDRRAASTYDLLGIEVNYL